MGNCGFAGFADLDFFAAGFQFIEDLYAFPFADRA
jgi:hypothetical protein